MAYEGTVAEIPLGELGLLTDLAPSQLPPMALLGANNITLVNGTVQKAPGSRKLNAVALPAGVVALTDWKPTSIQQRTIAACSNGSIYRDTGPGDFAGNVAIATGLTGLTPNSQFVHGGNETAGRGKKLFFFSFGENPLKVLEADEVTFSNITNPAADWTVGNYPRVGVTHRNRLWAFAGQISYASDSGDHENFTSDFLVNPVYPGEGDAIRGAFVFKGRLFCFKDGGFAYWLDDSDIDSDNWFWRKIASNFGLSAPNAVVEVLNDMLACNTTGTLTSYAATDALGDIESADVFKNAQIESYLRANTSKVGLTSQHAIYYPEKKQLFITYRSGYFTYNDMLVCIDFNRQTPRITFEKKGSPQCLAIRRDINEIERPIYGDKDGYVHFMDYEDRLQGSTSYTGEFQTIHFDMGHLDPTLRYLNKHWDHLSVTYKPESTSNLSCDYYVDGKFIDTVTFPLNQYTANQLSTFVLDTDRLAQANPETFTRPLTNTGRTISFRFYNAGSNQSFQISSIAVGFRVSSNQAQKNT